MKNVQSPIAHLGWIVSKIYVEFLIGYEESVHPQFRGLEAQELSRWSTLTPYAWAPPSSFSAESATSAATSAWASNPSAD